VHSTSYSTANNDYLEIAYALSIYTKWPWTILTCYNFEFVKPVGLDLCLFAVSVPQPKSNFVHKFALKIWHLVTTILMFFLRINWPSLGQV